MDGELRVDVGVYGLELVGSFLVGVGQILYTKMSAISTGVIDH